MTYEPGKNYTNLPLMSSDDAEVLFQNVDAIVEDARLHISSYPGEEPCYLVRKDIIDQARYSRDQVRVRWSIGTPLTILRDKFNVVASDLHHLIIQEQDK